MLREKIGKMFSYTGLIIWTFLVVAPLAFMFLTSFKDHGEILQSPFGLPEALKYENYIHVWVNSSLGTNFYNSIIVTTVTLLLLTFLSLMAGYACARFPFPGNKGFFLLLVILLTIPIHSLLIPIYYFLEKFGLTNSMLGIILVYTAFNLPISIVIMRAFFEQVPKSIEEAAMMDGCSPFRIFWNIATPMCKVGIATIAIINVIAIWSEYLFASVLLTHPAQRTLPVAIAGLSSGESGFDMGILFAGLSIATIPMLIIYFLFSKQITKGVASGAIK